jgi:hypothetical protein
LKLGGAVLVEQAALEDGFLLDPPSFLEDGPGAAEVGVGGRHVAEALVGAAMAVVLDEVADGGLERAGQVVVLEQDRFLSIAFQRSILPWVWG